MARIKTYTYQVKGSGSFPIDMLRYDVAWPNNETDSAIIEGRELRSCWIQSNRYPTSARWHSFLWSVKDIVER